MERDQWVEVCHRIEGIWPGRRMNERTVDAWFDAFGREAEYAVAMRAVTRLADDQDRAPSLAALKAAYRDVTPPRARREPDALEDRNDVARRATMAREWREINEAMRRVPRIREMFHAFQAQYPDATDAQATLVRMALIDEIKHLTPAELAPPAPEAEPVAAGPVADFDPFDL